MERLNKIIITLIISVLILGFSQHSKAQEYNKKTVLTDSVLVDGVCGMCKDRIENAALIKGVKTVQWNKNTHYLVVKYKPAKVSMEVIQKEIAKAGHDTGDFIADDKIYNNLPPCCHYRSGEIETH